MVPCQKILDTAKEHNVDVIGVSGLITPSLDEMVHIAQEMEAQGFTQPLLVGGATTSKRHAAVKLAPKSKKAIHVLDASRAVPVVQQLIGCGAQDFLDDIQDEYDEIRTEYYDGLVDKKWLPIAKAQAKNFAIDFAAKPPPKPMSVGNIAFQKYDLTEIRKYIDWGPFFSLYNLRGKYPNKGYPGIFKDATCGEMAKQMFDEANEMMDNVIAAGQIEAHAVVGIWPARSTGDDIIVTGPGKELTFYGLRQQQDMDQEFTLSHGDFIAKENDHIGAFACSCGVGVEKMKEDFHSRGEVDQAILLDAVADRLSEAYAELIHVQMRKQLWGYAPDEDMSLDDMLKVKYQGIRPAPGYPSQPDHREKETLFHLLEVEKLLGGRLELTESFMMLPAAAVCALVFAHPDAEYFNVGQVNKDQVIDYARRRGEDGTKDTERWLGATVLGYDA
jgi:5-methyltetrahydrofolate--homocysteine methyltransferase